MMAPQPFHQCYDSTSPNLTALFERLTYYLQMCSILFEACIS